MKAYIDQYRDTYGVAPICKVLQVAPSCYWRHAAQMREPVLRCDRAKHANAPCPLDRVNRQFKAERPNQLWVSDFTYVSTWQDWQYLAFVIDVYVRRIVGWRQSSSMRTDFVLDGLEQALYDRQPEVSDGLIHHSERLSEAGIEP